MSAYSVYNDNDLFLFISQNDERGFRELFSRYAPKLEPFIFGIVKNEMVAKEIVQDVFLRIWLKRETLNTIEKPASWIYRIASNLSLTYFRRNQLEKKVMMAVQQETKDADTAGLENLDAKELQKLINQASRQLPSRRRQIFIMSREKGLVRKEIAEQLGISENTVKKQLGISLKFIQEYIQKVTGFYIPLILLLSFLK
ncbi:MAG: polymerase sigma-70 factor [Chitinophagaceae bacterium]|nr:polymerase sigma-70 factor [Chitinophagaceae bacterium]